MIKLCKKLGYKPKYSSDADSMMLKHLASTVTIVLVCLAAISFSAYAFFSHSVTSGTNTIKASSFSSTVAIKKDNGDLITEAKLQSYGFDIGKYIVTFRTDSSTTGTGYYIIKVNGTTFYTQQLGVDMNAPGQQRNQISFVLDVKAPTTIEFESRWGTSSLYSTSPSDSEFYIKDTDPMKEIVVEATQSAGDGTEEATPEETKPDETNPEETTPETTAPEETTSPAELEGIKHTVVANETLSAIAVEYGVPYTRIAAYNNIPAPYTINPGKVIVIPPEDWVEPTVPAETTVPTETTE